MNLLITNIRNKYDDVIPYAGFRDILFRHKVDILKNGFMESNPSKLEQYLSNIFEAKDKENTGKLHISALIDSLTKADKIVFTKMQVIL